VVARLKIPDNRASGYNSFKNFTMSSQTLACSKEYPGASILVKAKKRIH
jgi:hypothetical protein